MDTYHIFTRVLEQFSPDAEDVNFVKQQLVSSISGRVPARMIYGQFITDWQNSQDSHSLKWNILNRITIELICEHDESFGIFIEYLCSTVPTDQWIPPLHWNCYVATLALAHPTSSLLDQLKTRINSQPCRDLTLHLVHEWIVQGRSLPAEDIDWIENVRRNLDHPLIHLPLVRLDIERLICPPAMRSSRGAVYHPLPRLNLPDLNRVDSEHIFTLANKIEITDWPSVQTVQFCFKRWTKYSAARLEFRVFREHPEVAQSCSFFPLPLLCLAGSEPQSHTLYKTSPEVVFQILFHLLAAGSPYSTGEYGAIGRLNTWYTIGALLGYSDLSIGEIARHASRVTWHLFHVDSQWYFADSPFNLGVAVVDNEIGRVAILAFTDVK